MNIKQIITGYEDILRTAYDDNMDDELTAYIEKLTAHEVQHLLDFAKNVTDVIRKQLGN